MDWKAVPIGPKSHKVKRTHQPSWSAAALGNKSANLQNKPKMTFKLQSTNIKTQPSKQSKETPVPPPQVPGQKSMNSATRSNVFKDTVETSVVEGVEEISVEKDVAETGALESASVVGIVRYSDANKLRPGESPVPLPNRDSHQPHSPQHAAEYLGDILPPQCVPPPRADIDFLGKLPCKRRLPPAYSASIEADSWEPMLYAIALAYIVGDEVTSPSMICNEGLKLPRSSPLAAKCISLPRSMPPELRQLFSKFETCVGCKHWTKIARQKNPCKWGRMTWAKKDDLKEAEPVEMDTDSTEPTDIAEPTDVESDVVALSSRATTPVAEAKLRRARKQSMRLQKLAHTTSRQASLEASQASTPPQVEKVARVDPWTMEDWEVCPGTIRSIDSDQSVLTTSIFKATLY